MLGVLLSSQGIANFTYNLDPNPRKFQLDGPDCKITENRPPACISERERVSLISGREIPRIATVMDGIRLAVDAIATVVQSYFESFGTTAMLGKFLFFQYNQFGVRSRMGL